MGQRGGARGQIILNIVIGVLAAAVVSVGSLIVFQSNVIAVNGSSPSSSMASASVVTTSAPSSVIDTHESAPSAAFSPSPSPSGTASNNALLADIKTAERVVGKFWGRHWNDFFPGTYSPPRIVGLYDGASPSSPYCGTERLPPGNAEYCRAGDYLAWDVGLMTEGYKLGNVWPYMVIAHEWGHAIQARLGNSLTLTDRELQADCLGGAALFGAVTDGDLVLQPGDQNLLAEGLSKLGDETPWTRSSDHGDSFQRIDAFNTGRTGGILPCFPTIKTALLGTSRTYDNGISVTVVSIGFRSLAPGVSGTIGGQAAVFQITVHNGSPRPLNASHMLKSRVGYGDRSTAADAVQDPATRLGSDTLGIIPPGESRTGFFGAGIPWNQASSVRIDVPGPDPANDWPASFKGAVT